jgi:hypothetical protein
MQLKTYEQGLMNALFKPDEAQINMNEVARRLATNWSAVLPIFSRLRVVPWDSRKLL